MIKKTIEIDGSEVHYFVLNPHVQTTLLCIHGFRGNHKALTEFSENLNDFRVILVDLPGYGLSTPSRRKHTMKYYSSFITSFVDALELKSYYLFGHSLGASICVQYAATRPRGLKKLILACPGIPASGLIPSVVKLYYHATYLLPKKWRKRWLGSAFIDRVQGEFMIKNVSESRKDELIEAGLRNLDEINPTVVVESLISFLQTNLYHLAAHITVPTLVIAGALDLIVPIDQIIQLNNSIPNSRLITIPDHGHLIPLEIPAHTATLIGEFI